MHASKIQQTSKHHWGENQKMKEQSGVGGGHRGMHAAKHLLESFKTKTVVYRVFEQGYR